MEDKNSIEYPCMNGFCDKCKSHYLFDGDESRCRKIKLGFSDAMCVQVSECYSYQPKGEQLWQIAVNAEEQM